MSDLEEHALAIAKRETKRHEARVALQRASARELLQLVGLELPANQDPVATLWRVLPTPEYTIRLVQMIWRRVHDPATDTAVVGHLALVGATMLQGVRPDLAMALLSRALDRAPNREASKMFTQLRRAQNVARRERNIDSARRSDRKRRRE